MKQIFILIMVLFFVSEGVFIPHAGAVSQGKVPAGFNMKRQHQTMRTINVQWNKLKQALAKDNFPTAQQAVQKMLGLAPEGEKFKLHRGPEKRDQFLEYQKTFVTSLDQLKGAIVARDAPQAEGFAKGVQNVCNQCHALFRSGHTHGR